MSSHIHQPFMAATGVCFGSYRCVLAGTGVCFGSYRCVLAGTGVCFGRYWILTLTGSKIGEIAMAAAKEVSVAAATASVMRFLIETITFCSS